ncbi:MAG: hypothetical protein WD750_03365 [Gammaproteobacteria bacterium]
MKTTWRFVIALFGALIIVVAVFAFMSLLYFKGGSEPSDEQAEMFEDIVG